MLSIAAAVAKNTASNLLVGKPPSLKNHWIIRNTVGSKGNTSKQYIKRPFVIRCRTFSGRRNIHSTSHNKNSGWVRAGFKPFVGRKCG